jgi:hypothetical protein
MLRPYIEMEIVMINQSHLQLQDLCLQEEFAGVVVWVGSLRGRMSEAGRQVEGLFESLLSEVFNA